MTQSPNNDMYTYKTTLEQDDRKDFVKVMMKEIIDHEQRKHWSIIHREDLSIAAKKALAIWLSKRKIFLDSGIQKYEARICAHGDMQIWGENYW